MNNTNRILAENIQKYRKRLGMTQEELAEKLGVTFQAVSKWETAKSAPDIFCLPIMAEVFFCSIDDLFSFVPQNRREEINIFSSNSAPEKVKDFMGKHIRSKIGSGGSTDKLLGIVAENIDGTFEMTDENIERLLDAYRDVFRASRKGK